MVRSSFEKYMYFFNMRWVLPALSQFCNILLSVLPRTCITYHRTGAYLRYNKISSVPIVIIVTVLPFVHQILYAPYFPFFCTLGSLWSVYKMCMMLMWSSSELYLKQFLLVLKWLTITFILAGFLNGGGNGLVIEKTFLSPSPTFLSKICSYLLLDIVYLLYYPHCNALSRSGDI